MNRVKLWVYMVLALAAGALFLRSSSTDAVARARGGVDRRLTAAAEQAGAALRTLDGQAAAAAAIAARDPALQQAVAAAAEPLTPPRGRRPLTVPPDEATREASRMFAARAAATSAAALAGASRDTRVEVWLAAPADFAEGAKADGAIQALLREAAGGKAASGRVVVDDLAWTVAAAPTGDGGALAVAFPLDAVLLGGIARATGVEATLAVPGAKPLSTVPPGDARAITDAGARSPRALADAGRLAPVPLALPLPVELPPAPLLFGAAPAHRVFALPLDGLKGGQLVLSGATRAELVPLVREQWLAAGGLAVLLVLGLLFGLLVRGEVAAQIPSELVAAAARIEKGDFGARAPALAGKLGTVAAALNGAAEAAEKAATLPPQPLPAPAAEPSFDFALPAARRAADPFEGAAAPAFAAPAAEPEPAPAPEPAPEPAPSALFGGAFEAAPVKPAPAPASPSALLQTAAATASPAEAAAADDEGHWRQIFEDFLRVRRECGEAAEGLTYDRFRTKLEKNRDQLVAKYACRTVRFQVYVKEGKAALKATPVR